MVRSRPSLLLLPALLFCASCSSGGADPRAEETISRDAFMDAFFELRAAALRAPSQEITVERRDQILEAQGLTQEDLLHFVEVWGSDPSFMEGIWDEIELMMRESRDRPDPSEEEGEEEEEGEDPGDGPRRLRPGGRRGVGDPGDGGSDQRRGRP